MIRKQYKVEGMHCTSCAMVIEGELEDVGVKATCHYAKAQLTVEFDEEKVSEQNIKQVVGVVGYTLTE